MNFDQLVQVLAQWERRRRLQEALLWVPRGIMVGLLLAVLVAAYARFRPLLTNEEVATLAPGLALLGLFAAAIVLLWQRRSLLEQARFADARFHLQERASTAVEIHQEQLPVTPELARQQLADTQAAAGRVDARQALPLALDRQNLLVTLIAALLLGLAIYLPNPQAEILRTQRAVAAEIEEQAEALEALAEEIEEDPALTPEQREELAEPVTSALQELESGDLSREEAVAVLSEAEANLRDLEASNSTEALRERLETAGAPLAQNQAGQSLGQSLQSGNLAQAGAAAAELADDLSTLSAEEMDALGEDLAATAAALQDVDGELAAELAQAAQALQNGDAAAAQQALREASGTLQERAQQQAASGRAAAAAGQLGEGRQAVAQAGTEGNGEGSGEGQGQGSGEGQGEGSGSGEGQGEGSGQGSGSGSGQGQGSGAGSGSSGGEGTGGGTGGIGGETGHAENVYVPDFADLSGEAGEDVELPAECIANPALCGSLLNETATEFRDEASTVPYNQVFGDYRDAAYEALSDDYVPLGMKEYVRDYFSSLEP